MWSRYLLDKALPAGGHGASLGRLFVPISVHIANLPHQQLDERDIDERPASTHASQSAACSNNAATLGSRVHWRNGHGVSSPVAQAPSRGNGEPQRGPMSPTTSRASSSTSALSHNHNLSTPTTQATFASFASSEVSHHTNEAVASDMDDDDNNTTQPLHMSLASCFATPEQNLSSSFQMERCIGTGGYGCVFEVISLLDGCKYAMKCIRVPSPADVLSLHPDHPIFLEALCLSNLDSHPNICKYACSWVESADSSPVSVWWDAVQQQKNAENGTENCNNSGNTETCSSASTGPASFLLILMEMCPGVNLREWLLRYEHTRVSVESVRRIFRQILDATDFVHQNGWVHGDISSHNVMICGNNTVKLIDFGLARPQGDPRFHQKVGMWLYAAPELRQRDVNSSPSLSARSFSFSPSSPPPFQLAPDTNTKNSTSTNITDNSAHISSDLFSLGVLLTELLSWPITTSMERVAILEQAQTGIVGPKQTTSLITAPQTHPAFTMVDSDGFIHSRVGVGMGMCVETELWKIARELVSVDPLARPSCDQLLQRPVFRVL